MPNNTQMIRKKDIITENQLLKEDFIESALMIVGFVPVIGEIADIILICRYIYKKQYLYAGLMLIALIPTVGDIIAKPFIYLLKSRKATSVALKNTDELLKYLQNNPQAKKIYMRLENHINSPLIGKTINKLENVPGIGTTAAAGLRTSITQHAGVLGRLLDKPINISKSIGKEIKTNSGGLLKTMVGKGPVAQGIKKHFQGDRLARYIEKTGKVPSNWLSNWYNIVYKGSTDRKNYVKKFIIANNILNLFGLPNLSAFEEKFETDSNFREELAKNKSFSELVGNTTTEEQLNTINNATEGLKKDTGVEKLSKALSLGFLKRIAQQIV